MEMKKRFLIIIVMITGMVISACGGQGMEVVSPPNPSESPQPLNIDTELYELTVDLPAGWTFQEYGPRGKTPGPYVFIDKDPETVTIAHFTQGLSRFTFFFSKLKPGETLFEFIRERHPLGEIDIGAPEGPSSDGQTITEAAFGMSEIGFSSLPSVFDYYLSIDSYVFWIRGAVFGTNLEQDKVMDELGIVILSLNVEPKI